MDFDGKAREIEDNYFGRQNERRIAIAAALRQAYEDGRKDGISDGLKKAEECILMGKQYGSNLKTKGGERG